MVNQADIHRTMIDKEIRTRIKAIYRLDSNFSSLPDKKQAWDDLIRFMQDDNWKVRGTAARALGSAFIYVPDKNKAWEDLHKLTQDDNEVVREAAALGLGSAFSEVLDKNKAWEDLHKLTQDESENVQWAAADALGSAFSHIPEKKQALKDLIELAQKEEVSVQEIAIEALCSAFTDASDKNQAWEDLISLTQDEEVKVQEAAAEMLGLVFFHVHDTDQAWEGLHKITQDENGWVRANAADALGSVYSHAPDKNQAWEDLHKLTQDDDEEVRGAATEALSYAFSHVPDKNQAWNDLHKLTQDKDSYVRKLAAYALDSAFFHAPDENLVLVDLHKLMQDEEEEVRGGAAYALGSVYPHVQDKNLVWCDLHKLTLDNKEEVREAAANALGSAFSHVHDKSQAWDDLHRLTQDEDKNVQRAAARALGSAFSHVPDKSKAWEDLHRLTRNENRNVRWTAANALGSVFFHIPDKNLAWDDLHRLTQDEDEVVRRTAAGALGSAFSHVPDNNQAWEDLHRLTQDDDDEGVRRTAANALGSAFSHVPDKSQAWEDLIRLIHNGDIMWWDSINEIGTTFSHVPNKDQALKDLHRLTQDDDEGVRRTAANALGSAFSHVPDKNQAWEYLHELAQDEDSDVRASAYYSMGRISVNRATNTENKDEFKDELVKAIEFFEKSSKEMESFNPASFCLPFYRSYYTIISEKQEAEAEVEIYLDEAKKATKGSESREKLLEIIKNISDALKEAQKPRNFNEMKKDLNTYRRYCDRASDLLTTTEQSAPEATKLIRKGLPIINQRIEEIIAEIQQKAKALCKKTKGTSLEKIGLETVKSAEKLTLDNTIKIHLILGNIGNKLNKFCEHLPDNVKKSLCGKIRDARNLDVVEQAEIIDQGFDYMLLHFPIPPIITVSANKENKQKQDIVRIAAIQFAFKLTNSFPPALEKKDECKQKIISALDTAKSSGAHIACLPELCMCEEWVQEFKDRYLDMIIIGGSYYKNDFNECPIIMNMEVPPQLKKSPSRFEDPEITGRGMKSGDKLYRYETQLGTFSVLVCIDFLNYAKFCDQTDIIFCPSYNEAKGIERFHEYANSHVTNTPSYIIISNTAKFGGTSIFGQLHRDYYRGLVENGCKSGDDDSYKLCDLEKGFEGIIIADFDLVHKSPQVPTPADSKKIIKSIKNIINMPII